MTRMPKQDVPLASHTVFKIGGNARYFYEAKARADLCAAVDWAKKYRLPYVVLGAGSNMLISQKGFPGLAIKAAYAEVRVLGNGICADAGAMLPHVAACAEAHHLAGFEWAGSIPGTIGGSVRGNAGCFGGSMSDVVELVEVYDAIHSREKKFSNQDCLFGYRESVFKKHPEYIILSATLSLRVGNAAEIRSRMNTYARHRIFTQAVGEKCAGCVFKNIPWDRYTFRERQNILSKMPELEQFKNNTHIPTAFVLDRLGLKKYAIGQAEVSSKHANFFINRGGATADEMMMLISHCKELVHRKTGILLEEEIQYV